jgi:hypothetical protein
MAETYVKVTKFKINEIELERLLNSENGPVGRMLLDRANRVRVAAVAQAGKRTGALKASIQVRKRGRYARGQYIQVGSNLPYARLHHEGTKPHIITPTKRRFLRFFSKGVLVYTSMVMHPGTRKNRYLTDNLTKAV